jgi:hypothetical protein
MLSTIEKAITKRLVEHSLNNGFLVGAAADDSADIDPTDNLEEILEAAFSYDCVDLILESKNGQTGFIALNYFNDRLDIISDYSTSLSHLMDTVSFKQLTIDL